MTELSPYRKNKYEEKIGELETEIKLLKKKLTEHNQTIMNAFSQRNTMEDKYNVLRGFVRDMQKFVDDQEESTYLLED